MVKRTFAWSDIAQEEQFPKYPEMVVREALGINSTEEDCVGFKVRFDNGITANISYLGKSGRHSPSFYTRQGITSYDDEIFKPWRIQLIGPDGETLVTPQHTINFDRFIMTNQSVKSTGLVGPVGTVVGEKIYSALKDVSEMTLEQVRGYTEAHDAAALKDQSSPVVMSVDPNPLGMGSRQRGADERVGSGSMAR